VSDFFEFVVGVIAVVLYIANIVKLAGATTFGLLEVFRVVGAFVPPLGVLMGFVG